MKWAFEMTPDQKIIESGVKIIAEEDRAVHEHILEGSHEGMKFQVLAFASTKLKQIRFSIPELPMTA